MQIFADISELPPSLSRTFVALGNFDGMHLGHQALIDHCVRSALESRHTPVAFTFQPHPIEILKPDTQVRLLTTPSEKFKLLERLGIQVTVSQNFNIGLSQLNPEEFFEKYLTNGIRSAALFVGDDFRFGKGRLGDPTTLLRLGKASGIPVFIQLKVSFRGERISSSLIRECVANGNLLKARHLLGRPLSYSGLVVSGDKRGSQLGFPTANFSVHEKKLLPPNGVYVARVFWKGRGYKAVVNIGTRPTFGESNNINIEAHLLDFDQALYGQSIRLELFEQLRPENCFPTKEALVAQIQLDIAATRVSASLD